MNIKGIIFDLDGVICSTDEYHYQAWKKIADSIYTEFDRSINNRLRGVSRMASLEIILEKNNGKPFSQAEKEDLAEQKNLIYRESLEKMSSADLSDEVKTTLEIVRKMGLKLAIGSSSQNTKYILERIGLNDFFDEVCDGTNITNSKPHPEVFLKAAEHMDLKPEECLVVEDAISGAEAGHAGGFKVACVGDASKAGVGDYNMKSFAELLEMINA